MTLLSVLARSSVDPAVISETVPTLISEKICRQCFRPAQETARFCDLVCENAFRARGPNVRVRVETVDTPMLYVKAWSTSVPGIVVLYDEDRDEWALTHEPSGKFIFRARVDVLDRLQKAAQSLASHDWTVPESGVTADYMSSVARLGSFLESEPLAVREVPRDSF